jgi:hypothetical protein
VAFIAVGKGAPELRGLTVPTGQRCMFSPPPHHHTALSNGEVYNHSLTFHLLGVGGRSILKASHNQDEVLYKGLIIRDSHW